EIASKIATMARGICQGASLRKPATKPPSNVPIAPKATPNAATVPTSIFLGSPGLALSAATTDVAAVSSLAVLAASAAAARLAIWLKKKGKNFLEGPQNRWAKVDGFMTIFVIGAPPAAPLPIKKTPIPPNHGVVRTPAGKRGSDRQFFAGCRTGTVAISQVS